MSRNRHHKLALKILASLLITVLFTSTAFAGIATSPLRVKGETVFAGLGSCPLGLQSSDVSIGSR